jgi:hypothetical protein
MFYDVFVSFESLGFEDYILPLNYKIQGKFFDLNKHTIGDYLNQTIEKPKLKQEYKVFKNIFNNKTHLELDSFELDGQIITQNLKDIEYQIIADNGHNVFNSDEKQIVSNPKDSTYQVDENIYFTENNMFEENFSNTTTNDTTYNNLTFEQIVQNQNTQSNAFTIEQLNKFEKNINNFVQENNYLTHNHLQHLEQKITSVNENSTKDLKSEINNTKQFIFDFLNR